MKKIAFTFLLPVMIFVQYGLATDMPAVIINEVLSSNNENIHDEDGDFEDWIEILNTGSEPVNLNGFGLTDRESTYFRWAFPDTSIAPGEFMIVWASGKDRRVPGMPLHTNFSIASAGEPLRLTHFGGTRLDTVPPVTIPTDYSYGRSPDGSDNWVFFSDPTPGAPNSTEGLESLLPPPIFSKSAGYYGEPIDLELSLPPGVSGAHIFYTTDGSEPGPHNGTVYIGPIQINNRTDEPNDISMIPTNNFGPGHQYNEDWKEPVGQVFKGTVIRAVTWAEGSQPLKIATKSYFVGENLDHRYQLPVFSLATNRENFFSSDTGIYVNDNYWETGELSERPLHVEFFESGGIPVLAQDAGVRIHGGTSRSRPIKSLRFYARRSYGESWFEYPLIPDAPVNRYKRFLLRNSGNDWDGTFFRDALMQRLVEHTGVETQYYRPSIVFINGEYWGIKNIRMRYDHRYVESMYGIDREDLVLLEGNAELKEGVGEDRRQYQVLRDLVAGNDMNHPQIWQIVNDQVDLENFRDYNISNIYFRNTDWPGNNIDFWRKRTDGPQDNAPFGHDGRWRWLLYDTDFGFNLDFDYVVGDELGAHHNTLAFAVDGSNNHWPNPQWSVMMLRGMLQNTAFKNGFIHRFADLLNTAFSEERVVAEIDNMYDVLKPHMDEHIRRWGGPQSMQAWEDEVESMRDFARQRPDAQRGHILSYFNLPGYLDITLDVNNPAGGHIVINSIDIKPGEVGIPEDPWPWTGRYFKDVPVTITAVPADGYMFAGWEGVPGASDEVNIRTFSDSFHGKVLFEASDVSSDQAGRDADQPSSFKVHSARPNPFNNQTTISVELPESSSVQISVFTVDGRRIGTVHDGYMESGRHEVRIDASHWASGVYILLVESARNVTSLPVTLIK